MFTHKKSAPQLLVWLVQLLGGRSKIGVFGADRWISNLGWRLTHIKTKIKFLENESIPNGSLLRMPDEYDPSPIKLALLERGMDLDIQKKETAKLDDDLYRLMEL